jgi:hypothetical protein
MGDSNYDHAKRLAWTVRKYTKAERKEIKEHYEEEKERVAALRASGQCGYIPLIDYD